MFVSCPPLTASLTVCVSVPVCAYVCALISVPTPLPPPLQWDDERRPQDRGDPCGGGRDTCILSRGQSTPHQGEGQPPVSPRWDTTLCLTCLSVSVCVCVCVSVSVSCLRRRMLRVGCVCSHHYVLNCVCVYVVVAAAVQGITGVLWRSTVQQ